MLAQNFKSATELDISEEQHGALRKVLVLLETGKLRHFRADNFDLGYHPGFFSGDFNMTTFGYHHTCGTAACIAGTAQLISGVEFVGVGRTKELGDLFYADCLDKGGPEDPLDKITPDQAAIALRSYLTTGQARWDLAVA